MGSYLQGGTTEADRTTRIDTDWVASTVNNLSMTEVNVRPKTGAAYNGKSWAVGTSTADTCDFNSAQFYGVTYEYGVTYAGVYVYNSGAALSSKYLGIGSDDGCKVWWNGTVVDQFIGGRGTSADANFWGPITINAGWNFLMVKVENGGTGHGVYARFANANRTGITSGLTTYTSDATAPSAPSNLGIAGIANDVWQNTVDTPTFTWTSGTESQGSGQGVSGVRGQKYYFGASSSTSPNTFQTGTTHAPGVQASGTYYFKVDTVDYALNESSTAEFVFRYDGTKPTNPSASCSDGLPTGIWRTTSAPTFTLSGASDAHSGLKTTGSDTRYRYYFGTSSGGTPATTTDSTTISPTLAGDGTYYLRVQTQDNAGNWSDAATVFTFNYAIPASITTQPANQAACSGSTAEFSVTAGGPSPSYAWRKRDHSLGWGTGNGWQFSYNSAACDEWNGVFVGSSTSCSQNPGINNNGKAFGLYAKSWNSVEAKRNFGNLSAGQTISFDLQIPVYLNGNDGSGNKSTALFGLRKSANESNPRLEMWVTAGDSYLTISDGTGNDSTTVPWDSGGYHCVFKLVGTDTYDLTVTRLSTSTDYTFTGRSLKGTSADAIDQVRAWFRNYDGNSGDCYNFYVNNIVAGAYEDNANNYTTGGCVGTTWTTGGNLGFGPISGATSSTYSTGNTGSYDVVVWNTYGQVISSAATLTVYAVPTANSVDCHRAQGGSLKIKISDLITAPDTIQSLGTATHGSVSNNATYIFYVPYANDDNNDSFTYTAANANSCTAQATVNVIVDDAVTGQAQTIAVVDGKATMTFAGIPGYSYTVQRATDVDFTENLADLQTTIVGSTGLFTFVDNNPPGSQAYYRLKYNP